MGLMHTLPYLPELTRVLYDIKGLAIQISDLHSSAFSVRFGGGTINSALPPRYPQSYPQVLGISSGMTFGQVMMLAFSTDDSKALGHIVSITP